jgi:LPS export ABC transporter protein LptC
MRRLLFFIAFMSIGTFGFYVLLVRDPFRHLAGPPRVPEPSNVLRMQTVVVRQEEGTRLAWELWAQEAVSDEVNQTAELFQVRFVVYTSDGQKNTGVLMVGTSGRAYLDGRPGTLVLEEKVRLVQGGDREIRSERIEYHQKQGLILAPGPVWVRLRDVIQEGTAMEYHVAGETMILSAPVVYQ